MILGSNCHCVTALSISDRHSWFFFLIWSRTILLAGNIGPEIFCLSCEISPTTLETAISPWHFPHGKGMKWKPLFCYWGSGLNGLNIHWLKVIYFNRTMLWTNFHCFHCLPKCNKSPFVDLFTHFDCMNSRSRISFNNIWIHFIEKKGGRGFSAALGNKFSAFNPSLRSCV